MSWTSVAPTVVVGCLCWVILTDFGPGPAQCSNWCSVIVFLLGLGLALTRKKKKRWSWASILLVWYSAFMLLSTVGREEGRLFYASSTWGSVGSLRNMEWEKCIFPCLCAGGWWQILKLLFCSPNDIWATFPLSILLEGGWNSLGIEGQLWRKVKFPAFSPHQMFW